MRTIERIMADNEGMESSREYRLKYPDEVRDLFAAGCVLSLTVPLTLAMMFAFIRALIFAAMFIVVLVLY